MKKRTEEFSFKDLVNLFLPKLWLILVVSVVFGMFSGVYSAFIKSDTYTSEALLMVSKSSNSASVNSSDRDLSSDLIATYKEIILSERFLNIVKSDIDGREEYKSQGWNITTGLLRSTIKITQRGESEIFNISATTEDQLLSYAIADATVDQVEKSLKNILPTTFNAIGVSIIDQSKLPGGANDKHIFRNALIGVLIGAVLTMVAIFVYSMFDVLIRDKKKLEDNFDVPVLGVIPKNDVMFDAKEEA